MRLRGGRGRGESLDYRFLIDKQDIVNTIDEDIRRFGGKYKNSYPLSGPSDTVGITL